MNGFFKTLARAAVSKAAAFSYAVAVGVAGNLVFHYVQTHDAVPNLAPPHQEAAAPAVKAPAVAPPATPADVTPAAAVVAKPHAAPAVPERAAKPAAVSAPVAPLPEPPANLGLPSAAA